MPLVLPLCGTSINNSIIVTWSLIYDSSFYRKYLYLPPLSFLLRVDSHAPLLSRAYEAHEREGIREKHRANLFRLVSLRLSPSFAWYIFGSWTVSLHLIVQKGRPRWIVVNACLESSNSIA